MNAYDATGRVRVPVVRSHDDTLQARVRALELEVAQLHAALDGAAYLSSLIANEYRRAEERITTQQAIIDAQADTLRAYRLDRERQQREAQAVINALGGV